MVSAYECFPSMVFVAFYLDSTKNFLFGQQEEATTSKTMQRYCRLIFCLSSLLRDVKDASFVCVCARARV